MYRQYSQGYYRREQLFNDRFPLSVVAVLAIIQLLTTCAIVALEIVHILINVQLTNLFAGFWTSISFTILWISMFATVCCCRRRSCATHAVVQNFIGLLFASALIAINSVFLRRPDQCFLTNGLCNNLDLIKDIEWSFDCFNNNGYSCRNTRLALIKAQLAAGALMAVTCLVYLLIYAIVASRVSRADRRQTSATTNAIMAPAYQTPLPTAVNYQYPPYVNNSYPYQPSALAPMPAPESVSLGRNNGNYMPTIYPRIPTDRF